MHDWATLKPEFSQSYVYHLWINKMFSVKAVLWENQQSYRLNLENHMLLLFCIHCIQMSRVLHLSPLMMETDYI